MDCYSIQEDEIDETDEKELVAALAETYDDEDEELPSTKHLLPQRFLNNFTVYHRDETSNNQNQHEIISLQAMEHSSENTDYSFYASGLVTSFYVEDDEGEDEELSEDEDEDEPHRSGLLVSLSSILALWFEPVDNQTSEFPQIWIQTQYAWYQLGTPSKEYRSFYSPLWMRHYLAVRMYEHKAMEFRNFWDLVRRELSVEEAQQVIDVNFDNMTKTLRNEFLTTALEELRKNSSLAVVKAVRGSRLLQSRNLQTSSPERSVPAFSSRPEHGPQKRVKTQTQKMQVTPVVELIARHLFPSHLMQVNGDSLVEPPEQEEIHDGVENVLSKAEDPYYVPNVKLTQPIPASPGYYAKALIDGVVYSAGDIVVVVAGTEGDSLKPTAPPRVQQVRGSNPLADKMWFARILSIYQSNDKGAPGRYMHVQWFSHSSKVDLSHLGHPNELFAQAWCDDVQLELVLGKMTMIEPLGPEDPLPAPDVLFSRYQWDTSDGSFTTAQPVVKISGRIDCPVCVTSGVDWSPLADGVHLNGIDFRWGDFVFIDTTDAEDQHAQYLIGRLQAKVVDAEQPTIKVRKFPRVQPSAVASDGHDVYFDRSVCKDRQIRDGGAFQIFDLLQLKSKVCVRHRDSLSKEECTAWVLKPDHYLAVGSELGGDQLRWCTHPDAHSLMTSPKLAPLRMLDACSGAGGISIGLETSGVATSKWAIEIEPNTAETYRRNHPTAVVYNQDVNACVTAAVERLEGRDFCGLGPGKKPLPSMPQYGEVDLVVAGFPCQGFSMNNLFKRSDDHRNMLVLPTLSLIEYYQPKFVLLENVPGLLGHECRTQGQNPQSIPMAIVQIILSFLTTQGYQVRWGQLQAAQYGAPQRRSRLFFLAAKRGLTLPRFPRPTHTYVEMRHGKNTGGIMPPIGLQFPRRMLPKPDKMRIRELASASAPHSSVTVHDAIGDLPGFDWRDPKMNVQEGAQHRNRRARFPIVKAEREVVGFAGRTEAQSYQDPLDQQGLSQFQLTVRAGSESTGVTFQATRTFPPARPSERNGSKVERVVHIPLKRNADYLDLPVCLLPWSLGSQRGYAARSKWARGRYGRIDPNGYFQTIITRVDPEAKQGRCLHPTQLRVLTVREWARAQGFPDRVQFFSETNDPRDMYRQIGNAVPVPLAAAIGREILATRERDKRLVEEKRRHEEERRSPRRPQTARKTASSSSSNKRPRES